MSATYNSGSAIQSTRGGTHVECVTDWNGYQDKPGIWADVFVRDNGTKYIGLGGGWLYYAPRCPDLIEETDPMYAPFIAACNEDDAINFAVKHWS